MLTVYQAMAFVTQPARMEELRKIFVDMDRDQSGCISIEEFKEAMAAVPDVPAAQVHYIYKFVIEWKPIYIYVYIEIDREISRYRRYHLSINEFKEAMAAVPDVPAAQVHSR